MRALVRPPGTLALPADHPGRGDALTDDDLQLALYLCYELHYRGFAGVDPAWEWSPAEDRSSLRSVDPGVDPAITRVAVPA